MAIKRYAFWPTDNYQFSPTLNIRPWVFYWLDEAEVANSPIRYEEVPEDASQVGTTLKRIFRMFGYQGKKCDCEFLRRMLDDASLPFIEKHADEIVVSICNSARLQNVNPPPLLIKKLLALSILRNRMKLVKLL